MRPARGARGWGQIFLGCLAVLLAGCAGVIPSSGPSASSVRRVRTQMTGIQIVDLTDSVANRLLNMHRPETFPEEFRDDGAPKTTVGPGDVLEVTITEAPPASLFGSTAVGSGSTPTGAQSVTFPEQNISSRGIIFIPFAGAIHAAGKTVEEIEDEITSQLKSKANQPQVLVRVTTNNTNYATVLGAVSSATHIPLTPARERILDAVTKACTTGGDVGTLSVQLTRGTRCITVPMKQIICDPRQNIVLHGGDVVNVMHQPYSFIAMGATSANQEIHFEGPFITLAQAMARAGGLNDTQANIRGVFVFRFESPDAIDWPTQPVLLTAGGKVRVVYWLDLSKPASFFAAKTFPVCDGDLIYTAHAPAVGLEKVLNLVGSITSPTLNSAYQGATTVNAVAP